MTSYRTLCLEHLHQQLQAAQSERVEAFETFKEANAALLDEVAVPLSKFEAHLKSSLPAKKFDNVLRFDLTPEQIKELSAEIIRAQQRVLDGVAALKEGWTWNNTLGAMEDIDCLTESFSSMVDFPGHVSADKTVRDASSDASKELQQFGIAAQMRVDVYESVLAFSKTEEAAQLQGERKRLLEHTLRNLRRNGLHLDAQLRDQVKEIKQRISNLCVDFQKNVSEENTTFEFTAAELEGLPQDKLDSLPRSEDGSKYVVSLKYPDYFPVMDHVKVDQTRLIMNTANLSRCMEANTPILEEVIALRHKKAQLLGFQNDADFMLQVRMAKSQARVEEFLRDMSSKVQATADEEMAYLLQIKEADCKETGRDFDGKIHSHEFRYYLKMAEQQKYDFDSEIVRPYFPLEVVLEGTFKMYQQVLGLRFEEVQGAHVWHEDVRLFNVYNAELTEDEAKELPEEDRFERPGLVGQFYIDLFPRAGKYSHAACFGLVPGHNFGVAGRAQHPVAACVANFPAPTKDKPSLLSHSDVVTFTHEMGHVFHQVLTETETSSFAGTRVETDFVEAPSQMNENWAWEKEGLVLLSGHVETGEKLPEDFLRKLQAAKNANVGLFTKRQLSFGLFDMHIHSRAEVDSAAVWAKIQKETLGIESIPGTNFAASFGHLLGGYNSGYYSYLFSELMSADMFLTAFKKAGSALDSKAGRRYRRAILSRGGSKDGDDLLKDFLGREPRLDAWLEAKGLSSEQ